MRNLITVLLLSLTLSAQFYWQDNGLPLRQGINIEWQRTIAPAENGSIIFVWSDVRDGQRDVYAQKIDTTGTLLWGIGGMAVTSIAGRQEDPVAITDGNGGAFIAWVDYRNGAMSDIYIQHLDATGSLLLDPAGIPICTADSVQISISMCTDSLGGVFLVWQDKRTGVDDDIYGTHVGADHQVVDQGLGVPIAIGSGAQIEKSLEYAGNNTAQVVWKDAYSGNTNVFGQRLNTDMSFVWTEKLPVAATADLESVPRTTFIGGDTALIAWQQTDSTDRAMYQLTDSNGLVLPEARAVSNNPASQVGPRVKRDGSGNVFIIWADYRHNSQIWKYYAQKVSPAGNLVWDSSGVALEQDLTNANNARFTSDGNGGIWCAWERGLFPETEIHVQHILNDGSAASGANGSPAMTIDGYQFSPILSGDANHGAWVVAADQESGNIDLVTQRITSAGNLEMGAAGLTTMAGMDGDVTYPAGFTTDQNSVVMVWEDSRNGKEFYGVTFDTSGQISAIEDGSQLTDLDGFSEPGRNNPYYLYHEGYLYIASFTGGEGSKSLRLNKVDSQFQSQWDLGGITVYNSLQDQQYVRLVPVTGGIGVIWSENRNVTAFDLFYQRYDGDGNPQLAEGGVSLSSQQVDEYSEAVLPLDNGDFILVWKEDFWQNQDLYIQRFTVDGLPSSEWFVGRYALCNATFNQFEAVAVNATDREEIFVIWQDMRSGPIDLYAQVIDYTGIIQWTNNGQPITTAPNDQSNPSLAYDAATGRVMTVWEDFRDGNDYNLWGRLVDLNEAGPTDTNFVICAEPTYQTNPVVASVYPGTFLFSWDDERGIAG